MQMEFEDEDECRVILLVHVMLVQFFVGITLEYGAKSQLVL